MATLKKNDLFFFCGSRRFPGSVQLQPQDGHDQRAVGLPAAGLQLRTVRSVRHRRRQRGIEPVPGRVCLCALCPAWHLKYRENVVERRMCAHFIDRSLAAVTVRDLDWLPWPGVRLEGQRWWTARPVTAASRRLLFAVAPVPDVASIRRSNQLDSSRTQLRVCLSSSPVSIIKLADDG